MNYKSQCSSCPPNGQCTKCWESDGEPDVNTNPPTKPDIEPRDELEKLLIVCLGSLMIRSEEYPNVEEIIAAIKPTLSTLIATKQLEARVDENWLVHKQAIRVADENGGSLRHNKITLEAVVYWTKHRISELTKKASKEA